MSFAPYSLFLFWICRSCSRKSLQVSYMVLACTRRASMLDVGACSIFLQSQPSMMWITGRDLEFSPPFPSCHWPEVYSARLAPRSQSNDVTTLPVLLHPSGECLQYHSAWILPLPNRFYFTDQVVMPDLSAHMAPRFRPPMSSWLCRAIRHTSSFTTFSSRSSSDTRAG